MNEVVQRRVDTINKAAQEIISDAKCIIDDCENFEGFDELFTIESAFDRIIRKAKTYVDVVRQTYDELDEGED